MNIRVKDSQLRIAVVGGGIVGTCCALCLQLDGNNVTIIDQNGPGTGCSSGNAGQIVTSYCVPLGLPGIIKQVPRMLRDPLGPLTIRWQYLPYLMPWLLRFVQSSSVERVERIADALYELNKDAVKTFDPLIKLAKAEHLLVAKGRLDVYQSGHEFDKAQYKFNLLRNRGVRVELLNSKQITELEPELNEKCQYGAFCPDVVHTTNPLQLTQLLAKAFQENGGSILREKVNDFQLKSTGVPSIKTNISYHTVDKIVIAAGAFSRPFAAKLGNKVPLDTERGYHVMLPHSGIHLNRTIVHGDRYFGMTPMQEGLRLAGTVELASVNASPNYARADNLLTAAKGVLPSLSDKGATQWMGCRPSMPYSLPVISQSSVHESVFFAFGHGHLGLTAAATTGKIITDLIAERPPHININPFKIDRF